MDGSHINDFPKAPIFTPSIENFKDPLIYLNSIYEHAASYGMCKIRPPKGWKPPFAINDTKFKFSPRIQNLADIDAYNRVRNNFITSLINFWELQEVTIFAQFIKGKPLDYFKLWQIVKSFGGYDKVTYGKQWLDVCEKLNLECTASIASAVSEKFRKFLLPFEIFLRSSSDYEASYTHAIRKSKRTKISKKDENMLVCRKCGNSSKSELLVICDGCTFEGIYHVFCLEPQLSHVPKGKWFCSVCFTKQFKLMNKIDEFGFIKSSTTYTLREFGDHADSFKSRYFRKPIEMIKTSEVEIEFWRLVNDSECDVSVEYGADLCVADVGSGFPTNATSKTSMRQYVDSPWNLNNFATNELSALRYIPNDISGMKVPWCYVGMAFSCFCWHTEDHWSFSINYLHKGEPKTWYSVPSNAAPIFEEAVRQEVPELFERSPDFLHHMTTLLPPHRLARRDVPIYTLDQLPGDFVITFPRAYHGGFNHGFNFAEAVNFCPASWFPSGRNCIDHYALIHRPPVFAHNELLCRMAESLDGLSIDFLITVTDQLTDLLTKERSLRGHLARLGVRRTERFVFETCEEEFRECALCKTTLFTSAVTCDCSRTMVCLEHYQTRTCCAIEDQVMFYRYGLDELSDFIKRPQVRLQDYWTWRKRVIEILECKLKVDQEEEVILQSLSDFSNKKKENEDEVSINEGNYLKNEKAAEYNEFKQKSDKNEGNKEVFRNFDNEDVSVGIKPEPTDAVFQNITLDELKDLVCIGRTNRYPVDLLLRLEALITKAEECAFVIHSLVTTIKYKNESEEENDKEEIDNAKDLSTMKVAETSLPKKSMKRLSKGQSTNSTQIKLKPEERRYGPYVTKLTLSEFSKFVEMVSQLPCKIPDVDDLHVFKRKIVEWRTETRFILAASNKAHEDEDSATLPSIATVEKIVEFGNSVNLYLPEIKKLEQLLDCLTWLAKVDVMLQRTATSECKPVLKDLINLQSVGAHISPAVAYTSQVEMDALEASEGQSSTPDPKSTLTVISALDAALSNATSRLIAIIAHARMLEEAVKKIIKSDPGTCTLPEAEKLLAQTAELHVSFEASMELDQLCHEGRRLTNHILSFERLLKCAANDSGRGQKKGEVKAGLETVSPPDNFPEEFVTRLRLETVDSTPNVWLNFFEEVHTACQKLPFTFPNVDKTQRLLTCLNCCHIKIMEAFLRPASTQTLLEILLPRPLNALNLLIRRDARLPRGGPSCPSPNDESSDPNSFPCPLDRLDSSTYQFVCMDNSKKFLSKLAGENDLDHLYDTVYTPMIESELKQLHYLRRSNMTKSRDKYQDQMTYCTCRHSGFSGFMLQCELCRDWFHPKCVGFPIKNVDLSRLRYTCPLCERSLRPELSTVILILEELIPLVAQAKTSTPAMPVETGGITTVAPAITSDLVASLIQVSFLLRLPNMAAVQMLCERAFAFVRRVRTVILSTPELRRALTEYESFSGIHMPWNNFNEEAGKPMVSNHHRERIYRKSGLSSLDLPPNVRPQGMQPLVLRTTGPRAHYAGRGRPLGSGKGIRRRIHTDAFVPLRPALNKRIKQQVDHDISGNEERSSGPLTDTTSRISLYLPSGQNVPTLSPPCLPETAPLPVNKGPDKKETEAAVALADLSVAMDAVATTSTPLPSVGNEQFKTPPTSSQTPKLRKTQVSSSHFPPRSDSVQLVRRRSSSHDDHHSSTESLDRPLKQNFFRFRLSADARSRLDTLITEACSLEVSLPQTRWLWQLSLAADPDCSGAILPKLALADETETAVKKHRRLNNPVSSSIGDRKSLEHPLRAGLVTDDRRRTSRFAKYKRRTEYQPKLARTVDSENRNNASNYWPTDRSLKNRDLVERQKHVRRPLPSDLYRISSSKRIPKRWNSSFDEFRRSHDNEEYNDESSYDSQVEDDADEEDSDGGRSSRRSFVSDFSGRHRKLRGGGVHAYRRSFHNDEVDMDEDEEEFMRNDDVRGNEVIHGHPSGTSSFMRKRRGAKHASGHGRRADNWRLLKASQGDLSLSNHRRDWTVSRHCQPDLQMIPSGSTNRIRRGSSRPNTGRGSRGGKEGPSSVSVKNKRPNTPSSSSSIQKRQATGYSSSSEEDEEEDEEEEEIVEEEVCVAPEGCRKPNGTVEWVACDRCNRWYHQLCVGILTTHDLPETYVCSNCRPMKPIALPSASIAEPLESSKTEGQPTSGSSMHYRLLPTSGNVKFAAFEGNQFELPGQSSRKRCHFSLELSEAGCIGSNELEVLQKDEWADCSHSSNSRDEVVNIHHSVDQNRLPEMTVVQESTFLPGDILGAEALLQAIEVLDSQPRLSAVETQKDDSEVVLQPAKDAREDVEYECPPLVASDSIAASTEEVVLETSKSQ